MALFLYLLFFIFPTFPFMHFSSVPPLLSLSCMPSPSNINPMKTLLDNLTMETPTSHYATFRQGRYTGLMQCRPGLSPKNCALCADAARVTILNLCPNSIGVSAWFDGCYVQISSIVFSDTNISSHSCSARDAVGDPARFVPALGTLFLKLRADVNIPTHGGFSHREIGFENINRGGSKIYGIVECVRSLSPQECDSCVAKASDELLFYCGGKNGGVLVHGGCLVRFESSEFYHEEDASSEGGGASFSVGEGENGGGKKKVVVVYWMWSGGVGCFVVVVVLAWLLRTTVLKRGQVGTSDFGPTSGKSKIADCS